MKLGRVTLQKDTGAKFLGQAIAEDGVKRHIAARLRMGVVLPEAVEEGSRVNWR